MDRPNLANFNSSSQQFIELSIYRSYYQRSNGQEQRYFSSDRHAQNVYYEYQLRTPIRQNQNISDSIKKRKGLLITKLTQMFKDDTTLPVTRKKIMQASAYQRKQLDKDNMLDAKLDRLSNELSVFVQKQNAFWAEMRRSEIVLSTRLYQLLVVQGQMLAVQGQKLEQILINQKRTNNCLMRQFQLMRTQFQQMHRQHEQSTTKMINHFFNIMKIHSSVERVSQIPNEVNK